MYTQVPRAVMWLIRGDEAELGETGQTVKVELGSFYISRGCITNEQFEAYRPDHVRHSRSPGDNDPAVDLSFRDADGYAKWYAGISRKPFRLPTELEWEMAARARGRTRYPWGDSPEASGPFARTAENSDGRCHPVDQVKPSKAGIYGMIGNVWEWTTALHRPFEQALEPGHDDLEVAGDRVIRGGGHMDPVTAVSCASRVGVAEDTARPDLGFRIVRSL